MRAGTTRLLVMISQVSVTMEVAAIAIATPQPRWHPQEHLQRHPQQPRQLGLRPGRLQQRRLHRLLLAEGVIPLAGV